MGGAVRLMAKNDEMQQQVRLSTADRLTILGIVASVFLAIAIGLIGHDRDITTLKEANSTLKATLFDVQQDVKVLRADVSEMKALLTRRAEWPVKADAVLASQPPSVEMGVGQ